MYKKQKASFQHCAFSCFALHNHINIPFLVVNSCYEYLPDDMTKWQLSYWSPQFQQSASSCTELAYDQGAFKSIHFTPYPALRVHLSSFPQQL